jgi:drug/metabolite transporter (DMT)-like permease
VKIANLALRFVLELCALAAVSYAGYHAVQGEAARLALGIAAPILFAVLWSLFAAHKARFPPPQPWKAVIGAVLLEVTAVVLVLEGQSLWAGVIAVVIAVNSALVYLRNYQ